MGTTSNTISFNASQVISYIHQGWHFNWSAVLENNNYAVTASQETDIIEKKWDKKNVFYYNDGTDNQKILIPMQYGTTLLANRVEITRIPGASEFYIRINI